MGPQSTIDFLSLPQELRDLIYLNVFDESLSWPNSFNDLKEPSTSPPEATSIDIGQDRFRHIYPTKAPQPAWLSLLSCCKTTRRDITTMMTKPTTKTLCPDPPTLNLAVTDSTAVTTWTHLPIPPSQIEALHININVETLWDKGNLSGMPTSDNKILKALFTTLKAFRTRGPYLSRSNILSKPLNLQCVTLSLQPAFDVKEADFFFRNSAQQFATLCGVFMIWVERLARSGVLAGKVQKLRWACEGVVEVGRVLELGTDEVVEGVDRVMDGLEYRWE